MKFDKQLKIPHNQCSMSGKPFLHCQTDSGSLTYRKFGKIPGSPRPTTNISIFQFVTKLNQHNFQE